jgi:hypothetical protein
MSADANKPPKGVRPGGHRRIDRVLGDDYLAELPALDLTALRARRDDARQEEADLSYLRRMLHGRIDLVRAEQARRDGTAEGGSLVDELPRILAEDRPASPRGLGRHLSAQPSRLDAHRRRVEKLVADVAADDLGGLSDAELDRSLAAFREAEAEISATRQLVQQAMDACTAEIGRRYRDGEADVADLLSAQD